MGYRVSWIARKGTSVSELLEVSGRQPTGERHDFPDIGWYLLELPEGDSPWGVLIADGSENFADLEVSSAQQLSQDGNETLYFVCSDTVMATELVCFQNGDEVWSVAYSAEDQSKQPALNGDLPQAARDILADLQAQQQADNDADYIYELTAELGQALVGFRHDVDLQVDDPEPFQVLSN